MAISKKHSTLKHKNVDIGKTHVSHAANQLLNEGKKLAQEIYHQGLHKITEATDNAEGNIKEYSDALLKKVQEKPLASVLIAAGVGFLLSSLFKK